MTGRGRQAVPCAAPASVRKCAAMRDAISKEPVRGAAWDPATIGMPGLDRLRAFVRGEMPVSPIQHLTGIVPVETGVGTMTFAMPAGPSFMGPTGDYLGGIYACLADAPLACAIISGLPEGLALTTQELSLHFLRNAGPESERLIARGHIIHGGRAIGLSEVHVLDAQGRLLAYGSSRCVTLKAPVPPPAGAATPAPAPPAESDRWVPPFERPAQGAVAPSCLLYTSPSPRDS